jgi:hypothetical protein
VTVLESHVVEAATEFGKRGWLESHETGYRKARGNRQVQMIAIGGAIWHRPVSRHRCASASSRPVTRDRLSGLRSHLIPDPACACRAGSAPAEPWPLRVNLGLHHRLPDDVPPFVALLLWLVGAGRADDDSLDRADRKHPGATTSQRSRLGPARGASTPAASKCPRRRPRLLLWTAAVQGQADAPLPSGITPARAATQTALLWPQTQGTRCGPISNGAKSKRPGRQALMPCLLAQQF